MKLNLKLLQKLLLQKKRLLILEKNQRKLIILEILDNPNNWLTAREILEEIADEITFGCITTLLHRYFNFGYIRHRKDINGYFIYGLGKNGKRKLEYLKSVMI